MFQKCIVAAGDTLIRTAAVGTAQERTGFCRVCTAMPASKGGEQDIVVPTDWREALPRKVYSELERVKSNQTWFEVYKVNLGVFAFYEPGQFEEALSYLVVGDEKAALIDTGMGIDNVKTLAEEFTRLPVTVVNTHSHYDHIAQNYMFDAVAIFDATCARQASKNGYSSAEMKPLLAPEMLSKDLPQDFDFDNYRVPAFNVTRWLKDRDVIDLGNRRLEVVHTPGHSPDSICLLDRDAGLFWTGDTFYPGAIYIHMPGSNLDAFINSYEKMIALSSHYDTLLPSHNEPCVDKTGLGEVLRAAQDIRAGKGEYVEGNYEKAKVRRYEYSGFAIITKSPRHK